MFENKFCQATVMDVSESFNLRGMLSSSVAEVGIHLMREKYRGSTKLIVPLWVCVSCRHFSDVFLLLTYLFFPRYLKFVTYIFSVRYGMEVLTIM
jgi:hypothetical protein